MAWWPLLWVMLASALLPLALRTVWLARGSAGDDWKLEAFAAAGDALRGMLWLGLPGPALGAVLLWLWMMLGGGELPGAAAVGNALPGLLLLCWLFGLPPALAAGAWIGALRPWLGGWPGRVLPTAIGTLCSSAFCWGWSWLDGLPWAWLLPLGGLSAGMLAFWRLR